VPPGGTERLYRAEHARAVAGFVCQDRPDRPAEAAGEVVECAPYLRRLIMGLGEQLAVDLLERRGFTVTRLS
jgi:hypothetical protein